MVQHRDFLPSVALPVRSHLANDSSYVLIGKKVVAKPEF